MSDRSTQTRSTGNNGRPEPKNGDQKSPKGKTPASSASGTPSKNAPGSDAANQGGMDAPTNPRMKPTTPPPSTPPGTPGTPGTAPSASPATGQSGSTDQSGRSGGSSAKSAAAAGAAGAGVGAAAGAAAAKGSAKRSAEPTATPESSATSEPGPDETAVRPSFAQRLQEKLRQTTEGPAVTEEPPAVVAGATSKGTKPAASASRPKAPRRARLRLTHIDPWSVMKTAFLLSIAFGIVTVVAVAMIWTVLDQAGLWGSVNDTIQETIGGPDTANFDIEDYLGTSRVLGFTMLVAAVDVILITAIATLGAFLYNMSASLLGGVDVTLSEDNH